MGLVSSSLELPDDRCVGLVLDTEVGDCLVVEENCDAVLEVGRSLVKVLLDNVDACSTRKALGSRSDFVGRKAESGEQM